MFDSTGLIPRVTKKKSIIHFLDNNVELSCSCLIQQACHQDIQLFAFWIMWNEVVRLEDFL